jgi:xylan 1,4-beta-xylosidase
LDISTKLSNMTFPVSILLEADSQLGRLLPIYRFFGADEPNYAYMKDGEKLLKKLGEMGPEQVFFRAHNLLVTGDGTPALKWGSTNAYTEDEQGNPIYNWTIIDRIFDTYLERGIKPYVQIGFTPEAMSTHPQPYKHSWTPRAKYHKIFTGWAYPPKDFKKWEELVYQWAKHCVEKYGLREVNSWYWETWNEPNIGYWQGTPEQFYSLHDHATAAVRHAIPDARIGGPETAGGFGTDSVAFLREFLDHCVNGENLATGAKGSRLDFLSFHAKGQPEFLIDHVRMGMSHQLNDIDKAFGVIASFPTLKNKPIVIGESDPEGAAAAQGPELGYRNGTMYSSYTAASFARKYDLAAKHGVNLEGALTWAFEFEDQSYFAGFRVLASNNIDLPVLNIFRMFARMTGTRVKAQSSGQVQLEKIMAGGVRDEPDVGILASVNEGRVAALVWHYHDDDVAGPVASVKLELRGLSWSGNAELIHFRVDENYSNSFEKWKAMGSPQQPTAKQYAELTEASKLAMLESPRPLIVKDGGSIITFDLPRQGVSLLLLQKSI